ncbi:hypothetical protein QEZ54_06650 [Catellatospora sp. KI3]|uniref:hypothetical protein n=1 Tax=Catellatospora sp. KI3 TaxID=3041620 RepID=UPI0024828034|nr:hypothetical protein [Catellatospora sp. KI3]MDI1460637.1 hypothetical protein [Catellatospora sp. KI3]
MVNRKGPKGHRAVQIRAALLLGLAAALGLPIGTAAITGGTQPAVVAATEQVGAITAAALAEELRKRFFKRESTERGASGAPPTRQEIVAGLCELMHRELADVEFGARTAEAIEAAASALARNSLQASDLERLAQIAIEFDAARHVDD